MIVLIVNGKERQYEGPANLQDYVESLGVNVNNIAVAHNGEVLRRDEMPSINARGGRPPGDSARRRRRLGQTLPDNLTNRLQLRRHVVQHRVILHARLDLDRHPSERVGFDDR